MNKIVIDVGGTTTTTFIFNDQTHEILYSDNTFTSAEFAEQMLYNKISILKSLFKSSVILLGLPGDVNIFDENVYCAPLGRSMPIKKFLLMGVEVVNDTKAYAVIWNIKNKVMVNRRRVLITLGTSVGVCLMPASFRNDYDTSNLKSFEFAHEIVSFTRDPAF